MWWRKRKKQVRAQEFVIEDNKGVERVRLEVGADNNVVLRFFDIAGKSRLYLGLSADGTPHIGLQYAKGKGSIQLEANDKLNSAALVIVGPTGKAQVLLGVARNGQPAIVLYDDEGNQVFPEVAPGSNDNWNDDLESFDWDEILRP